MRYTEMDKSIVRLNPLNRGRKDDGYFHSLVKKIKYMVVPNFGSDSVQWEICR
jgi:hypothetical protein